MVLPIHCRYSPFKGRCTAALNDYMTNNPGRPVKVTMLPKITRDAYLMSFSAHNIVGGFQKTGMSPFNSQIFTDENFMPAEVTDRPMPPKQIIESSGSDSLIDGVNQGPQDEQLTSSPATVSPSSSITSRSGPSHRIPQNTIPEMIRPKPKYVRPADTRVVCRAKSAIYTDTPEIDKLKAKEKDKSKVGTTKRALFGPKPNKGCLRNF